MKYVTLSLAYSAVIASLKQHSPLPSPLTFEGIGEHLRESVTIYMTQTGPQVVEFPLRAWLLDNYPQFIVPIDSNAPKALVQLYLTAQEFEQSPSQGFE